MIKNIMDHKFNLMMEVLLHYKISKYNNLIKKLKI